jgi:nucleoside-diphosphate-sugar epimerase
MIVLVTGGGGFLGKALVKRLLSRGDRVRSLARGAHPELERLGVDTRRGDVGDAEAVWTASKGVDAVVHVAGEVSSWGPYARFHRTNVTGTENVIAACRAHAVRKLVYTSSPSVVHGGDDVAGGDESLPYATTFEAHYPHTKAIAERLVLAANDGTLSTVALRPHLIWGPGDTQLLPRAVAQARAGTLRLPGGRPGRAETRVDCTYIDNAVDAHVLALDQVQPGASCAGHAYFISNGEPLPTAVLVNRMLEAAGAPTVTKTVPPRVAYLAGCVAEAAHALFRRKGEPRITRFVARQMMTSHYFDIRAAKRDLGYEPRVSIEEGLARLRADRSEYRDHTDRDERRDHPDRA